MLHTHIYYAKTKAPVKTCGINTYSLLLLALKGFDMLQNTVTLLKILLILFLLMFVVIKYKYINYQNMYTFDEPIWQTCFAYHNMNTP